MAQASAESRLDLAPGTELHGFVVERAEQVPEIEGTAYIMRHRVSGTPLMWLANDDENMAFSIAFKTPPADDTGVFHILEHSVLCGSDRYPVKEPFVDLLKTSMQTFLNALTFSDKTMYPVASTNEQDLLNLMDVYMDAVLHPALYSKPTIFEQEGWHYEVDGLPAGDEGADEAAEPAAPNLRYNGVVFNEMKGALSDPDEAVLDGLSAALFPQTAYRFVSGGHPRAIPTLTYESYKDTHRRHYNLANAKVVLYGDLSLDRELAWLDERYLACAPEPAGKPNPLELQPPVVNMDAVATLATTPDNAAVALGYVAGTYADRERSLALEILSDALMGSNEAPLKRELLEADLGADVDAFVYDGLLQPFFVVELRGADEGAAEKFTQLVDDAFARMVTEGVPRENLEAALESAAFSLRERDFGYADGVALAINAMCGWLYSDDMPTDYLRYEEALANLKAGLDTGYWERLVREVFVESTHRARCVLVPVDADAPESLASQEAAELAAAQASMDAAELEAIAAEAELLHRLQAEPDTPEAAATLPRLAVADIGAAREEPAYGLVEDAPLPCLYHEVPTRRIDYVYHYFDLVGLTWDELPYVTLACSLLGKMGTAHRSAAELDTLVESRLGRLSFQAVVHEDAVSGDATPRLMVGASAIAENVADLAALPTEVWGSTDFSDVERIRRILQQQRIDSEQAFAAAGNSYALARAFGYCSKNGLLAQRLWRRGLLPLRARAARTLGRARIVAAPGACRHLPQGFCDRREPHELHRRARRPRPLLAGRRPTRPGSPGRGEPLPARGTRTDACTRGLCDPLRHLLCGQGLRRCPQRGHLLRHLAGGRPRLELRLPVGRDPRAGGRLRLRLPPQRQRQHGLLHLPRPQPRRLARPHRRRRRVAACLRARPPHHGGLHREHGGRPRRAPAPPHGGPPPGHRLPDPSRPRVARAYPPGGAGSYLRAAAPPGRRAQRRGRPRRRVRLW